MATTPATIPSAADLQAQARTTAGRCGVALGTLAAYRATTSPINGEHLHSLEWVDAAAVDSAVERAQQAFRSWRTVPAPGRGAVVKRLGELLTRAQARPGHADQPRGRQDHLGGARRGAGDDRHLRLRRRPVTAAVRPDDAVRAAGTPADGDLAPPRRRRGHQRLQLPGRRLVVEHRRRPGLRRPRDLEAVGAGAVDRRGERGPPRPRALRAGRTGRREPGPGRRGGGGAGPGRPPRGGAAERHRFDPHGPCGGPARRRAVRTLAAGARREQRRRRRAVGRPGPGHPRHRVLGCRDGRPAVHHDAPGDRPLQRHRRAGREGVRGVCAAAHRQPPGDGNAGRSTDPRRGLQGDAELPGGGPERRGNGRGRGRPSPRGRRLRRRTTRSPRSSASTSRRASSARRPSLRSCTRSPTTTSTRPLP